MTSEPMRTRENMQNGLKIESTRFPALRVSYVYLHRVLSGFLDCLSPF